MTNVDSPEAKGWRPARSRVDYLSDEDYAPALSRIVAWWARHDLHVGTRLDDGFPLAVTAAEIIEALGRAGDKSDELKKRHRISWNTSVDGQMAGLIFRARDLVAQPKLVFGQTPEGGYWARQSPGDLVVGVAGLRRALDDLLENRRERLANKSPVQPNNPPRQHALIYLDLAKLNLSALTECLALMKARDASSRILAEFEHVIGVSIKRIDALRRFRAEPAWRARAQNAYADQQLQVLKAEMRRKPPAPANRKRAVSELACLVVRRPDSANPNRLETIFSKPFTGSEAASRRRLESVLQYNFAKTGMVKWDRRTSVLQIAMVATAVAEAGDCHEERGILAEALDVALAASRGGTNPPSDVVIVIARTSKWNWRDAVEKELRFVFDVWAMEPKPRREYLIKMRKQKQKPEGWVWLDPHETSIWRPRQTRRAIA